MENLHPVFVHFPVALLLTSCGIEAAALALKRSAWHRVSIWNLALGTIGAAAAVVTGRMAQETAKHTFEIHQVMSLHEKLGYVVLGLCSAVLAWRLLRKDRLKTAYRWLAWGLLLAACGVMVFSAHLGGRLVYEFGVGGIYGRPKL
ncbi:MAG: DUF2231 domain-containing protein [Candidatus Omnitrophica bacterium]|nr:DUF2231 domain-containing protein [Candidatus Omnitrophota bacterium]